ncbi:hypothetical protein D3C78_1405290 [compost metagenome]
MLWITCGLSKVISSASSSLARARVICRSSHFTFGRLVAFIDSESKPIAISSTAAAGSPAISPQMLTGLPSAWESSTTFFSACSTAGCR